MFRNNPYMVRSEQLVKSHERIGKSYVTKDAKTFQRWCTFSDKVLRHLCRLNTKAIQWEENNS